MKFTMFALKTINLENAGTHENRIVLLFDLNTSCPSMYPLLYSIQFLRYQNLSTQYHDLIALKFWYMFWYQKFSTSFCVSFYSSSYNFEMIQNEIDNFIIYLENNKTIEENVTRLRNVNSINYTTIGHRIRSLLKFYSFLIDQYLTVRSKPQLTLIEINNIKNNLNKYINKKKKQIKNFPGSNKNISNGINYSFKSMNNEMIEELYRIIYPGYSKKINQLNPFSNFKVQLRNFLIVYIMLNYGLRIGEVMLLTINSIKKSIIKVNEPQKFNMIITNTEDEFDERERKPKIKNDSSFRVIELVKQDYEILQIYIHQIREEIPSQILFTSLVPPYSALSYSSICKIFKKIETSLKTLHPKFFDSSSYDFIESLTPHTCRHSWAYMMLGDSFTTYKNESIKNSNQMQSTQDALIKAQENLRAMGGWSSNSLMPAYYGKRFIVERANSMNLSRIEKIKRPNLDDYINSRTVR